MDTEKINKVIRFTTEHFDDLDLKDQLMIATALCELAETVTPIYEKYNKEPVAIVKPKKKKKDFPLWEVD